MQDRGKVFLNESLSEGGSVRWQVKTGVHRDYSCDLVQGELQITDCSKEVNLDFDCREAKHISKRIEKLDVLIDELDRMRDALKRAEEETKRKRYFY